MLGLRAVLEPWLLPEGAARGGQGRGAGPDLHPTQGPAL